MSLIKAILVAVNLLLGAAFAASFTGSTSLVVAELGAYHAFLCQFAGGTLFFIANRLKLLLGKRLERRLIEIMVTHLIVLAAIRWGWLSKPLLAYLWLSISSFSIAAFHWLTGELISRHVEPARVSSFINLSFALRSMGSLATLGLLRSFAALNGPIPFIQTEMICYGIIVITLALGEFRGIFRTVTGFSDAAKFSQNKEPLPLARGLSFMLIGTTMLLFLGRGFEAHALRIALKSTQSDFADIQHYLAQLYMSGHGFAALLALGLSSYRRMAGISPFRMLTIFHCIIFFLAIYVVTIPSLHSVLAISIVRYSLLSAIAYPALERIYGGISKHLRIVQRSTQLSLENTIGSFVMLVGLPVLDLLSPEVEVQTLMVMITVFSGIALIVIANVVKSYRTQLVVQLANGDEDSIRTSVLGLAADGSQEALQAVQKTSRIQHSDHVCADIARSLAMFVSRDATAELIVLMRKSSEPLQIECLKALSRQKTHEGINFVINASTGKFRELGPEVRLAAGKCLAEIYGQQAIPLLIDGLKSDQPRTIANALESLFIYRDKSLIPLLQSFVEHENPRVSLNAAMALFHFPAQREAATLQIGRACASPSIARRQSGLYAIGYLRHRRFAPIVESMSAARLDLDQQLIPALFWAVLQLELELSEATLGQLQQVVAGHDLLQQSFCYFFGKVPVATRQRFLIELANSARQDVLPALRRTLGYGDFRLAGDIELISTLVPTSPA